MVMGEVANFLAYSYAPAILVTPLGAVSVLVGAILAHFFLNERLGKDGIIGCALCIIGSVGVILHSPEEVDMNTVEEVATKFTKPCINYFYKFRVLNIPYLHFSSFYLLYICFRAKVWKSIALLMIQKHMLVYITICSLVGSISVMAVKGLAVAVKVTVSGDNQFDHLATWIFLFLVVGCAMTQINYFNKALDLFSTNRGIMFLISKVNPIYYVFFSTATILASIILTEGVQRSTPVKNESKNLF